MGSTKLFSLISVLLFWFGTATPLVKSSRISNIIDLRLIPQHRNMPTSITKNVRYLTSNIQNAPPPLDISSSSLNGLTASADKLPTTTMRLPSESPRGWVPGGPCGPTDVECMSVKMTEYVNEIRENINSTDVKLLSNGAESHLRNAMNHSEAMKARGSIYHQDLRSVDIGCDAFFSGENVAKNHCLLGPKDSNGKLLPTDPAKMCVTQFFNSPPHRKNLESQNHQTVIMGILMADDGYIWCTQTFAQNTKFTTNGGCRRIDGIMDENSTVNSPDPTSTPTLSPIPRNALKNVSSNGHKFRTIEFFGRFPDGRVEKLTLNCTPEECRYCTSDGSCLREDQSISIDQRINP